MFPLRSSSSPVRRRYSATSRRLRGEDVEAGAESRAHAVSTRSADRAAATFRPKTGCVTRRALSWVLETGCFARRALRRVLETGCVARRALRRVLETSCVARRASRRVLETGRWARRALERVLATGRWAGASWFLGVRLNLVVLNLVVPGTTYAQLSRAWHHLHGTTYSGRIRIHFTPTPQIERLLYVLCL